VCKDPDTSQKDELSRRIARIEPHVRSIRKIIENERTYQEIVQQVSAVRASLHSLTQVIVDDLVEHYVEHSKNERTNDAARELRETVSRIL
jgi:CsoR family transcriptional regulator, copper-sensing transcriptional repressor